MTDCMMTHTVVDAQCSAWHYISQNYFRVFCADRLMNAVQHNFSDTRNFYPVCSKYGK